jgi:hypothetical protein
MTTFAPNHETGSRLEALEVLTRDAWARYSSALRDLAGREYEEAEKDSWRELRATLRKLDAERELLLAPAAASGG